jgi:hypothetical protein
LQVPDEILDTYNLRPLIHNGYLYVEIAKGMYGLPQAGKIANDLLAKRLARKGYYQCRHTPGLWKYAYRPIQFSLVVNDFSVEYVGKEHADHLHTAITDHYDCSVDWTGSLYCGITLAWDYTNCTLDISMPGYVAAALHHYHHDPPSHRQDSPHPAAPKQYCVRIQLIEPVDTSPILDEAQRCVIQQIIGTFLYCARDVDPTMNVALSSLSSKQSKATTLTQARINQFLDYAATHPDATIQFYASDMQLKIHSDAGYLNEPKARSRTGGHFYLGNQLPTPDVHNRAVLNPTGIPKHVVGTASEAELGSIFVMSKEGIPIRTTLEELGWLQTATTITTDNSTAAGVSNNAVKQTRSKSMDMRFYWIQDRIDQNQYIVIWAPGSTNKADYYTKHHTPSHHRRMRPIYLFSQSHPITHAALFTFRSTARVC